MIGLFWLQIWHTWVQPTRRTRGSFSAIWIVELSTDCTLVHCGTRHDAPQVAMQL